MRGENFKKLTDADVRGILLLLEAGDDGASIGRRYGVSKSTVSRIRNAKTWKRLR